MLNEPQFSGGVIVISPIVVSIVLGSGSTPGVLQENSAVIFTPLSFLLSEPTNVIVFSLPTIISVINFTVYGNSAPIGVMLCLYFLNPDFSTESSALLPEITLT